MCAYGREVCDFRLDWQPGAKVWYHSGAAHWVQAILIEAVTGQDYREVIRQMLLEPLGLQGLWIGVPETHYERLVGVYQRGENRAHTPIPDRNEPAYWRASIPGGGGFATPTDMVTFYQMLLHLGQLNNTLSNSQLPEPLHSQRLDEIANLAHAAVVDL